MKTIFATLVLFAFAFVAHAENDGTVSVLNTTAAATQSTLATTATATTATATTATATTATVACACEEARAVKLAPWTVRRLNRVADRQEAREARKCCCCKDACACAQDCCKAPKTLVVENRRKCNCCR